MISKPDDDDALSDASGHAMAVLAGGCFWCVEHCLAQIDGVRRVTPGYSGGAADTARYPLVCGGDTGHAEAVRVEYDPARVTYGELLRAFFVCHDPTQLNRQGYDVGTQYRSAIFYADERQRQVAERYVAQLNRENAFGQPVVTQIAPLAAFFDAEPEHHGYAARHPEQPYIMGVSRPKAAKLREWLASGETRLREKD